MVPVFILGMYKSGTNWLLACLCAHPQIRGLREVDAVRATLLPKAGDASQIRPRADWLPQLFRRNSWGELDVAGLHEKPGMLVANLETRLTRLVEASGWRFANQRLIEEGPSNRPLGLDNLTCGDAAELIRALHTAVGQAELIQVFVSLQARFFGDPPFFVTKAADGMVGIDLVRRIFAPAKIIVIVRDGRDATTSAIHFRQLRAARGFPDVEILPYEVLLRSWTRRAEMVAKAAEAGKIGVIRYEDLSHDFGGAFGRLLAWLGADASPSLLRRIERATSFEAMTGRPRGKAADDVIRKGAVHDWITELGEEMKQRAWEIAAPMLVRFGYSQRAALSEAFPGKI